MVRISETAIIARRMAAGVLACVLWLSPAGGAVSTEEYRLKAVFLFNFTQFIEWPAKAFASADAPFVIGVLGQDPFGLHLDEAVRGESVNGHSLAVERFRSAADLRHCQILFIDRSASSQLGADELATLAQQGTLTVSDSGAVTSRDVVIRFLNANSRIRLRINIDTARSSGLVISSKLLRPAELARNEGT